MLPGCCISIKHGCVATLVQHNNWQQNIKTVKDIYNKTTEHKASIIIQRSVRIK